MHRLIVDYDLADKLYLNTKCEAVIARKDGKKGWLVEGTVLSTGVTWSMHTELAAMCTNRRLGAPRKLMFPDEDKYKGQIARGLNSVRRSRMCASVRSRADAAWRQGPTRARWAPAVVPTSLAPQPAPPPSCPPMRAPPPCRFSCDPPISEHPPFRYMTLHDVT